MQPAPRTTQTRVFMLRVRVVPLDLTVTLVQLSALTQEKRTTALSLIDSRLYRNSKLVKLKFITLLHDQSMRKLVCHRSMTGKTSLRLSVTMTGNFCQILLYIQ